MSLLSVSGWIDPTQECKSPRATTARQDSNKESRRSSGNPRLPEARRAILRRVWMLLLVGCVLASQAALAQNGVFASQSVGGVPATLPVIVTAQVQGTVAKVEVLTLGASGPDFTGVDGSPKCSQTFLAVNQTCTESVTFNPAAPGPRLGAVVLLDSSNTVLATTYLSGTGLGGLGVLVPGNVITVAGVYRNWNSTQDGILATAANLNLPSSMVLDGAGNLYIADSAHNRIRMVAAPVAPATAGIISTYAGAGQAGYTGDGGPRIAAELSSPSGLAIDGAGNLYIADAGNNVIREIDAITGIISRVAGNVDGAAGSSGDGGLATSAYLDSPMGVTVDASGNIYIADTKNQRIRKVDAVTGKISTVAGNGDLSPSGDGTGTYSGDTKQATSAGLSLPYAVAFDASGNMYIPDSANNVVRMVTPLGIISTVAGQSYTGNPRYAGDDGPALAAYLTDPSAVAVDPAGNLYIADTQNNAIRKVNSTTQNIATIAYNGSGNSLSPGGALGSVAIYAPIGLLLDPNGNLYFADYYYMLIREIQSNEAVLNYTLNPIQVGNKSAPQTSRIENDGNAALDLSAFTPGPNAAIDNASTTCSLTTPLNQDEDCLMGTVFAPALSLVFPPGATAEQVEDNVDVYGNTVNFPLNTQNFPLDIVLVGDATPVNATTLSLLSSSPKNSSGVYQSNYGQALTFTATVTSGATAGTPAGTVAFTDGATTLAAAVPLNASGVALFTTTSRLAVGEHTITATFTSATTANYLPSSSSLIQDIGEVTKTTLISSANPAVLGSTITFTATVTISGGGAVTPDLAVTFTDTTTGTILGSPTLGPSGIVTVSTASLAAGMHTIGAAYPGDPNTGVLPSSATLSNDVQAPSTTSLIASPNPSTYGLPVALTVSVPNVGAIAATGTVNLLEAGQIIGQANLSGSPATGTFTTSSLATGSDTLTAAYVGDVNYGPSTSSPVPEVVNKAQTSTGVVASPTPGIAGAPMAITATVSVIVGSATTTGTVTFADGTTTLGTAPLTGAGSATINPVLALGAHSIIASYSGDTNDTSSVSVALPVTVVQATTGTIVASSQNPSLVQLPVTFTAKVTGNGGTPSGSVAFFADGASIGSAPLAAGTATLATSALAAGTHSITAAYTGDTNDLASASAAISQVVGTLPTIADLGQSATTGASPQVILVATILNNVSSAGSTPLPTPTGTVTFSYGSTIVGSSPLDSSGVATQVPSLPNGTYSIVAAYAGDAQHSPSTSKMVPISTNAQGFNITVTPAAVSMPTTQNATVSVSLTSTSGFTDSIGLGCDSLPAGVTCHFSTPSTPLTANGSQQVALTIDTNSPLSGGSSAMTTSTASPRAFLAGLLMPFSLLFGCIFWRFRLRFARFTTIALILITGAASLLVTGCSGFTQSSASPGTYVIQVTGVGADSNITHYQNVTLTITK